MKKIFICKTCEKQFIPLNKYSKNIYCSKKCYGVGRTGYKQPKEINEKISKTKREKGDYQNIPCEVCEKTMNLNPYWRKLRKTCSRACAGKLNSERLKKMWKNPPQEMIEKMREKMIQRRSKGRLEKETKPERIFREELEKRKIKFEPQYPFGKLMIADFFIPKLRAFVFIDGSYWHGLLSSKEKDWQQVMYIQSKGMKAYRFTDKDVYKNVESLVDKILEDSPQPFSFAELIDKYSILAIKKELVPEELINQVLKDYRRMEKITLSGLELYNIKTPEEVIEILKKLFEVNCKIFSLMENGNDLKTVKELNKQRSTLKNSLNDYFDGEIEVKTYE